MATSGEYLFNPVIAEIVDDAFEDCGVDPETLVARHVQSARRCINFLLVEWENRNVHQFLIERTELALSQGQASFTPPAGTLDILFLNIIVPQSEIEIPLDAHSRSEWTDIPDKDREGRPDRYFIEKGLSMPTVHLWPVTDGPDYTLVYYRLKRFEDAGVATNSVEIPREYQDALRAGIAERLSRKYAPQRRQELAGDANRAFVFATQGNRERADLRTSVGRQRSRW